MSMQLDDAQVMRHTFAQVAEQCQILREEMGKKGIFGQLQDDIVSSYFNLFMGGVLTPNPADILKMLLPEEGKD